MKTILVTGSEGFVGGHLMRALRDAHYEVVATSHPLFIPKQGHYVPLDILNSEMVRETIKTYKPDIVFHLAAISSVSKSFRDPLLTYNTNIIGTANLIHGLKNQEKKVLFIFVSTCEIYGGGEDLDEESAIILKNPYAISKYSAELICSKDKIDDIEWIILRPFNHAGPGQAEDFVLPTIAKQIAEIEKNKRPPLIEIGNVEVKREFINILDIIEAYKLAIDKCRPREVYNISANAGYTLAEVLEICKRLSKDSFEVKVDPARVRKIDIPVLTGDGSKFSSLTGWQPRLKIDKTIEDLLNFWRSKI